MPTRPARSSGNRLAVTIRHHGADSAQAVEAARVHKETVLAEHIKSLVDSAPPFTAEQRTRLASLLIDVPVIPIGGESR